MTSVNDFHERSPRGMFWEYFTSLQGVEGYKVLWTTTRFELPLQHNSVRHYGERRESRRKNDGEHAPIKTVARKNIVRKMSQIYADMTTAPFRILHGEKILN